MKIPHLSRRWCTWPILALLLLFSFGCQFKLGTSASIPSALNPLYLHYRPQDAQIILALKKALKTSGVTLIDNPNKTQYTLDILQTNETNRQVGVGSIQETRRYDLRAQMSYVIKLSNSGQTVFGPLTVSSTAPIYVYSGQVLGNNEETVGIYRELRQSNFQTLMVTLASEEARK